MMADLSLLKQSVPENYDLETMVLDHIKMMAFTDDEHLFVVTDHPMLIDCTDLSVTDVTKPLHLNLDEMLSYSVKGSANMSHFSPYGDVVSMVAHHYPLKTVVFMPLGVSCTRFPEKCFILTECQDLVGFGFNESGTVMVCGERNYLKIYRRKKHL